MGHVAKLFVILHNKFPEHSEHFDEEISPKIIALFDTLLSSDLSAVTNGTESGTITTTRISMESSMHAADEKDLSKSSKYDSSNDEDADSFSDQSSYSDDADARHKARMESDLLVNEAIIRMASLPRMTVTSEDMIGENFQGFLPFFIHPSTSFTFIRYSYADHRDLYCKLEIGHELKQYQHVMFQPYMYDGQIRARITKIEPFFYKPVRKDFEDTVFSPKHHGQIHYDGRLSNLVEGSTWTFIEFEEANLPNIFTYIGRNNYKHNQRVKFEIQYKTVEHQQYFANILEAL